MNRKSYTTEQDRLNLLKVMTALGKQLIKDERHVDGNYLFFIDQEEVEPYTLESEPSELDILGQQLVEKDLQILELQMENQLLGSQIVDIDLRLLMGGL